MYIPGYMYTHPDGKSVLLITATVTAGISGRPAWLPLALEGREERQGFEMLVVTGYG